ncbi:MAG: glutathione peroxidase [Flavobacterium sp.]|nr:glutathione peroxidase [Flavobacterium sp.]
MKNSWILVFSLVLISCQNQAQQKQNQLLETPLQQQKTMAETIYQFKVTDLAGNEFDFSQLKGKKIMVVNTASKCGLTPQYKDLEAVYKKYQDQNFVIVGFPANNFGSQEPGTNEEISTFCQRNYGVTFPMMAKVSVVGNDMCALYQFLTQKSRNGLEDSEVAWNFQKYLINENGQLEKVISPQVLPTDASIIEWIEK